MLRLKRTKAGATHYATAVAPGGVVAGWSKDAAAAVALTEGVAKRVRDRYAGKKLVGDFTFEKVDATDMQLASAAVVEDEVGAAEFGKLQKRCKQLETANAELEKVVDEARSQVREAGRREQEAVERAKSLESQVVEMSNANGALAGRVAELEALLATATEPSKPPEAAVAPEPKPEPEPKGRKAK